MYPSQSSISEEYDLADISACAVGRLRVEWNFLFIFVAGYSLNVLLLAYMLRIAVAVVY